MKEREITLSDVIIVLKKCRVTEVRPDPKFINDVWNAEAKDLDGRCLRVCVSVNRSEALVIVVTAIDLGSKK